VALLGASCAAPGIQPPGASVNLTTQMPTVGADEIAAEKRRQLVLTLQGYLAQSSRVEAVAHRLLVANRADCRDVVGPRYGMQGVSRNDIDPRYRDLVAEAFNLDAERLTVLTVVPGGPAAKAGIAPGDVLVTFNGEQIPTTRSAQWLAAHRPRNS